MAEVDERLDRPPSAESRRDGHADRRSDVRRGERVHVAMLPVATLPRMSIAPVDLPAVMAAWAGDGPMPPVPYLLGDMAADAVAVLDACAVERADIVGASL